MASDDHDDHIHCGCLPEGTIVLRRTTVICFIDPESGRPDLHLSCDAGPGDDPEFMDANAHIGDLECAKLALWDDVNAE